MDVPASRNSVAARYAGARVAVLGAAGFIGRAVAQALCRADAVPLLVVRDEAGASRVFESLGVTGHVLPCDLEAAGDVRRLLRREQPAVVFNLAGYGVDPAERAERPASRLNAELVAVVCETLADTDARGWEGQRIVHAGSALEYGAAGGALSETTTPHPTTLYGTTKLAGTRLLQQACGSTGLRGCCARLFTVYGPGELQGRLLPTLVAAARGQGAVDLSAGTQRRDFTYLHDVVEGLLRLGVADLDPGTVVNLATGRLTSVRAFVEIAALVLGIAPARLQFGALSTRPEEMEHDGVDVRVLESLTGWRPVTTPADGIARTVAQCGWNGAPLTGVAR